MALVAFALVALCASKCPTYSRSGAADRVASELKCGMTATEIRTLAESYGLNIEVPDSNRAEWNLVATVDMTRLRMKLGPAGLERYQLSWIDTIQHSTSLPAVDLCGEGHRPRLGALLRPAEEASRTTTETISAISNWKTIWLNAGSGIPMALASSITNYLLPADAKREYGILSVEHWDILFHSYRLTDSSIEIWINWTLTRLTITSLH